jgi:hypothetical protein
MNKTLLLIICDFLLLNLLALTQWDAPTPQAEPTPAPAELAARADRTAAADLVASMQTALEEERTAREQLAQQWRSNLTSRDVVVQGLEEQRRQLSTNLTQVQASALELSQKLAGTAQTAAQTQARLTEAQQKLTASEQARGSLADSLKKAEVERQRLAEGFTAEKQRLVETLNAEKSAAQRQQEALAATEKARREVEQRAADLAAAVRVAEAEKNLLRENVTDLRQRVTRVEQEKERIQTQATTLASGVQQLANRSEELKQEFRDSIPINANLLFNDFVSNRVAVAVSGVQPALIGSGQRQKEALTVLVTDGTRTGALLHLNDTPLAFSRPGFGFDRLEARVTPRTGPPVGVPIHLLAADPRVVVLPLDTANSGRAGVRIYPLARNPFRYPEAVLISRGGRYYGEVEFRLDPRTPGYVRMKTKILTRLFGEFSPSAGDVVLSKTGELLGVMANGEYCLVLKDLLPAAGGVLDANLGRALMGQKLEEFRAWQDRLPLPLQ